MEIIHHFATPSSPSYHWALSQNFQMVFAVTARTLSASLLFFDALSAGTCFQSPTFPTMTPSALLGASRAHRLSPSMKGNTPLAAFQVAIPSYIRAIQHRITGYYQGKWEESPFHVIVGRFRDTRLEDMNC